MDDEETPKLSWDHQTFFIEGKPFYPDLSEQGNALSIRLPCEPHADLNWKIPSIGSKRILWEFELGLHSPFFPLTDELHFHALSAALQHFSKEIWPSYKEQTLGGILYRGPADFSLHFSFPEKQQENYQNWLQGKEDSPFYKQLFCADAFAAYFQLLAHKLPDELPLVLCLDTGRFSSRAQKANLLSKERFEHFLLAADYPMSGLRWNGSSLWFEEIPATLGVCFPEGAVMTESLVEKLDGIFHQLDANKIPFRLIPEAFLTEQWQGLDEIYILRDSLSSQGLRKLKGFEAAGGIVREEIS